MQKNPKQKILDYIMSNPSTHLRSIKNNVGYSMGTVQYHLKSLEDEGKIKSESTKFYKYFYPFTAPSAKYNSVLHSPVRKKIVQFLIQNKHANHTQLAEYLNVSSSTVTWHIKKLVDANIIRSQYCNKYRIYSLKNSD